MKPTLSTRKPVVDLSNSDLRAFPIWEFALGEEGVEGRDETWVKPVASTTVPLNSYSQIAAATFQGATLPTTLDGFMMVTTANRETAFKDALINLGGITPGAIITKSGAYYHIPVEARSEAARTALRAARIQEERIKLAGYLNVEPDDLFPLHYRLVVLIGSESSFREGIID